VELTPPLEAAAAPAPLLERWRTWAVRAYTQPGTLAATQLAEATTWLVLVSLLAMVLEGAPEFGEAYGSLFFVAEVVVVALFTADYVANIILQPDRRAYIFGVWGIIDLLAILPFLITLATASGGMGDTGLARSLLALRALRVVRVLKLAKVADEAAEGHQTGLVGEQHSFLRDAVFGLVAACAVLAIAEALSLDDGHQLYWLGLGTAFAFSIAARRWCVRHERSALAAMLVLGSLATGTAASVMVDVQEDPLRATITTVLTLLTVVISWIMVEGKEGLL
jgi:hypothetical protein